MPIREKLLKSLQCREVLAVTLNRCKNQDPLNQKTPSLDPPRLLLILIRFDYILFHHHLASALKQNSKCSHNASHNTDHAKGLAGTQCPSSHERAHASVIRGTRTSKSTV